MASIQTGQITLGASAVPLSATPVGSGAFEVKVRSTNAGPMFWGGIGVTTATGHVIEQGETFVFERRNQNGAGAYDLSPDRFYVCGTPGDVVTWVAFL